MKNRRVRISGNGTMIGTKITYADTGEIIGFVQRYTVTQNINQSAKAVIEVLLPSIDLECDAEILKAGSGEINDSQKSDDACSPSQGAPDVTDILSRFAPHECRVIDEYIDLDNRRGKLLDFIGSDKFFKLDPEDRRLLTKQSVAMGLYAQFLMKRIDRFKPAF